MSGYRSSQQPPQPQQDVTRIVEAIQASTQAINRLQQTFAHGLAVNTSLPVYTVAGLPATAPQGAMAYASNGRNSGEGAAAGTGLIVVGTGAIWKAPWSNLQVVA